jgi:subtilisin family serine protease
VRPLLLLAAAVVLVAPATANAGAQPLLRTPFVEPATPPATAGAPLEWQLSAAGEDAVPAWVAAAASRITIAVIDTGADLTAPALAAKDPSAYDIRSRGPSVADTNGHGTFVASLAAGSLEPAAGISGFGGDARLLVIRAGRTDGSFTDVDEAAAIVYAVDHGAQIVNLSFGGAGTSRIERFAIRYAVAHGVLLIAAAGNERAVGNPVEYPAALLQPVGSRGAGGTGLVVAASDANGRSASFSNTGSYISLAAPGVGVLGAVSALSSPVAYPRTTVDGAPGLYGFASGTSFAAPEVAGAAALVWAANPMLTAAQVAQLLKQSASGHGHWTPDLGYGVIHVAAAVAAAAPTEPVVG